MATIYDGIPMGYEDNTQNPYNYKQALREQLGSSPVPPQYYLRSFAPEPAQPTYPNKQAYIQSLLQEAARRQLLMEQMQNQRACGGRMFDDGGDLQAYQNMHDYMRQSEYNPETVYDSTPVQEVYDVPYEEYDPAGAILADKQANYPTQKIIEQDLIPENAYAQKAYELNNPPIYATPEDAKAVATLTGYAPETPPTATVVAPTAQVEETTAKTKPLGKITATNTIDIQQELVNRGYLNNRVNSRGKHREVDGIWGARTAAAYKKYLEDQYKQDNGKDTLDRNDRKIIEGEIAKMNKEKKYNPYNKEKNTTVASASQKKSATTTSSKNNNSNTTVNKQSQNVLQGVLDLYNETPEGQKIAKQLGHKITAKNVRDYFNSTSAKTSKTSNTPARKSRIKHNFITNPDARGTSIFNYFSELGEKMKHPKGNVALIKRK